MKKLEQNNFIISFEESIRLHWDSIAITEMHGCDFLFSDLAEDIAKYHIFWREAGLQKGSKIAILSNNSAQWAKVYMAAVTGGYVAVLLRPNVSSDELLSQLTHSDAVLLYAEEKYAMAFERSKAPNIDAIVDINQNIVIFSNENILKSYLSVCNLFEKQYPSGIVADSISYSKRESSDVCTIIYTSGTTGSPKGVMLSVGCISENMKALDFFSCVERSKTHINMILPFSHVYGLVDELIAPLCLGKQLIIMGSLHSPSEICSVCMKYRPKYLLTIPLILQSIIEYLADKKYFEIGSDIEENRALHKRIIDSLGGGIEVIYSSGTSCSTSLEKFIVDTLKLPLMIGYGMTECCTISLGDINHVIGSCGKIFNQTEVRMVPANVTSPSGEIQVRGSNIFSGYYKDSIATSEAFTDDGWLKTGDLGFIDKDGYLFITGRCKDMLLTSNGENIYPEEIESMMNVSPFIKESILVQRGEKLYAIVVPDREKAEADGLDAEGLNKKIDEAVREASKKLPGFTIISGFELREEPLERTPKGSLKRYLYSDGIKKN